jgi:hypothetical protein
MLSRVQSLTIVPFTDQYDHVYTFRPDNMLAHGELAELYEFTGFQLDSNYEHDGVVLEIVCHPLDADKISVNVLDDLDKAKHGGCETGLLLTAPRNTWVRQMAHSFAGQAMSKNKIARNQAFVRAKNKSLIAARNTPAVTTLIVFKRAISANIFHAAVPGRDPSQLQPEFEALAMEYEVGSGKGSIDLCMLSFYVTYKDSERQLHDSEVEDLKEKIGRKLLKVKERVYGPDPQEQVDEMTDRLQQLTLERDEYEKRFREAVSNIARRNMKLT